MTTAPTAAATAVAANAKDDDDVDNDVSQLAHALAALTTNPTLATPPPIPRAPAAAGEESLVKLAEHIERAHNIIVMCGAGISVSAGIPDFRTPGTGLYSQLAKYKLPRPEAIFEVNFFRDNPDPFYKLCSEIWPTSFSPTPAHRFIKLLDDKKKLLRCFTQNIDSLESLAGLSKDKIVAAHGNFDSATCIHTRKKVPIEEVEQCIRGKVAWEDLHKKHGVKRVKPDIVFFGEALPERFFTCSKADFPKCDLLIVMGTSLQVHPFASLADFTFPSRTVPKVLINREAVGPFRSIRRDDPAKLFYKGDTDIAAQRLVEFLGWRDEFVALAPAGAL